GYGELTAQRLKGLERQRGALPGQVEPRGGIMPLSRRGGPALRALARMLRLWRQLARRPGLGAGVQKRRAARGVQYPARGRPPRAWLCVRQGLAARRGAPGRKARQPLHRQDPSLPAVCRPVRDH
ncbi:MAG: hypothetical protein ACK55Z_08365, partial [bacterium]